MDACIVITVGTYSARAKKLLFAAIGLTFATGAFGAGGGIVDFENFSNSLIYTNSAHNGPATGLMSGDHAYYFALLEGFTNATTIDATLNNGTALNNGGWIFSGNLATNTPTPGLLNGNYTSDPGVLVDFVPGEHANFAVVGWSANIGTTYADAKTWWNNGNPNTGPSGYFAISTVAFDVTVGGGPTPVPTIFGPEVSREIQGMTLNLYTIPEPSTFALAGFGAAALLALRRRK